MLEFDEVLKDMYRNHEQALKNQMNLSDDWTMRDLPWMKKEFFQQLVDIIGQDNIAIVSGSERNVQLVHNEDGSPKGSEPMVRATLFVNKQGRENIKRYAEEIHT